MLVVILISCNTTIGQITKTKMSPTNESTVISHYDSTENFLGKDVYAYIGQELYLNELSEGSREYGYRGFVIDYKNDSPLDRDNKYKCCSKFNSNYDSLATKYFKVIDVLKHPKSISDEFLYGNKYYLKLIEKSSHDTVYFEYDTDSEYSFPFIVVGFFEKQKKVFVGSHFVFRDIEFTDATDIHTGKVVTIKTGQKWECIDLTIEDKYYKLSLIFKNSLGEKVADDYSRVVNVAFTSEAADNYKKKFGEATWNTILAGKVKIGMTKEMCRLSWGSPKRINETITASKVSEQWVYSDNYLYFDNNILKTIQ